MLCFPRIPEIGDVWYIQTAQPKLNRNDPKQAPRDYTPERPRRAAAAPATTRRPGSRPSPWPSPASCTSRWCWAPRAPGGREAAPSRQTPHTGRSRPRGGLGGRALVWRQHLSCWRWLGHRFPPNLSRFRKSGRVRRGGLGLTLDAGGRTPPWAKPSQSKRRVDARPLRGAALYRAAGPASRTTLTNISPSTASHHRQAPLLGNVTRHRMSRGDAHQAPPAPPSQDRNNQSS